MLFSIKNIHGKIGFVSKRSEMMTFDYKKEYKEFYMPKKKPNIITIPPMNYLAVKGKGNPNDKNGDYQQTISLLYNIAYTIKMSYKSSYQIDGFFQYVVPPLEGFWWQEGVKGMDYQRKDDLQFISLIRDVYKRQH